MKKLLLLAIGILLSINIYGFTLNVDRIDMNSVTVYWDTLPTVLNVTGYKAVYSSTSPFTTTSTANIKDIGFWELKSVGANIFYTLRPIDYGSIYNLEIVPIMSNNISWTASTNMITFTTRSDYWAYNMLARDDLAIKDLVGVTCVASDIDALDTLMSITVTAGTNWYITEISTNSIVAGLIDIFVDGLRVDSLANNVYGTAAKIYSIPMKVTSGQVLSAVMTSGTSGVHYITVKYYSFNGYGK